MLRDVVARRETVEGAGIRPIRPVTHGADSSPLGSGSHPARLDNFWAGVERLKDLGWDLQAIEYQAAGAWCVFQRRPSSLAGT